MFIRFYLCIGIIISSAVSCGVNDTQNNPPVIKFSNDDKTIALYHFNEESGNVLLDETGKWNGTTTGAKRVKGLFGNALQFNYGDNAKFDTIIPDKNPAGTLELFLMFDDSIKRDSAYSIFGNDGSRCNIFYKSGYLIFMKNQNDIYKYVEAKVTLKHNTWYHVAGTWGNKGMCLFVNDSLIARNTEISLYQCSPRTTVENQFRIGEKSYIGMGAIGLNRALSFEGYIDEVRISNVERY